MLYKFKSKATGDVIMLEPHGNQVLKLIGKEPAAQGIIEPPHMAAAIAALERAVAQAEATSPSDADSDADSSAKEPVGLLQRVWPMVEMLKRAQEANAAIVWGV
jgi:hypothetical protein